MSKHQPWTGSWLDRTLPHSAAVMGTHPPTSLVCGLESHHTCAQQEDDMRQGIAGQSWVGLGLPLSTAGTRGSREAVVRSPSKSQAEKHVTSQSVTAHSTTRAPSSCPRGYETAKFT